MVREVFVDMKSISPKALETRKLKLHTHMEKLLDQRPVYKEQLRTSKKRTP